MRNPPSTSPQQAGTNAAAWLGASWVSRPAAESQGSGWVKSKAPETQNEKKNVKRLSPVLVSKLKKITFLQQSAQSTF